MPRAIVASIAAGLLLAGCAADSPILERALVMPSAYDPLTCPEVAAKYKAADVRVKELAALMEKSGSPIANALAYNTEYATARANQRFAEQAAARKGCDLGNKPPPVPTTTLATPTPPGPLELAPPAAAPAGPRN
jgi:outer membrane murein-binding lipoprotein Lpp